MVCVCACTHACAQTGTVTVRGQLSGFDPTCSVGSWDGNRILSVQQQVPLPAEPSRQSSLVLNCGWSLTMHTKPALYGPQT